MDQPFCRQNAKFIRESTISPVIKSITEFDHNNPLTENQRPTHFRGKSVTNRQSGNNNNILHKLGNLDDALLKAQNLLDNKPKDENYLYLKGRVLEKLERTNEAEK
jgi:ClpP class serine protease